jgi:alcohol dehydrogenase class IV
MLLPHVMEFNLDAIVGRLSQVAHALAIARHDDSDQAAAEKLLARLREWTAVLEIPQDLRSFGVSEEHLEPLAVAASKVKRLLGNNPKVLSHDDIKAIYKRLLP